ncbi:putative membrane protein [Candidatus Protofrankia californiensis]|uniref:Putative membrane protein n=1 Tax=Candidatus Protofrankia californiensis TaxID=1839754 RepID=A0A1C3NVQ2_9ACTN|nr:putative membrane protein [Candidatus Protofrankia californiensis]
MTGAVTFAVLMVTAYPAHALADHVIGQTDRQAALKATRGWAGWTALARHVGAYHLIVTAMTAAVIAVFALPVSPVGAAAGLAVSAATHALWNRRAPVH